MVLVFARGLSDDLIGLIKKVNEAVAADPDKKTRGFVAFLQPPDEALKKRLAELAEKEKIQIPLTIAVDRPPKGYPIAEDAYVTVLVYSKRVVKQSFALREKELVADAVDRIAEAAKNVKAEAKPEKKGEF